MRRRGEGEREKKDEEKKVPASFVVTITLSTIPTSEGRCATEESFFVHCAINPSSFLGRGRVLPMRISGMSGSGSEREEMERRRERECVCTCV